MTSSGAPHPHKSGTGASPTRTGIGAPSTDTDLPATNTGLPAIDTGLPANDTGLPAVGAGSPAIDTGLPANDTGLPAVGAGSPRVGGKKPIPPPPGRRGVRMPSAFSGSTPGPPPQPVDHFGQHGPPDRPIDRALQAGPPDRPVDHAGQAGRSGPRRPPVFPEQVLRVTPLADPVLDRLGHDPLSTYVERFWLPIYGPSCLLLIRKLAADLANNTDGFEMDTVRWANELGVGMKGGRNGPLWRAVERGCRFGAMQRNGDLLAIRRRLPPLTARQVERLPPRLRASHDHWVETRLARPKRSTITKWSEGRTNQPLDDAA